MPTIDPMLNSDEKFSVNRFPGDGSTVTWNLNFSGGYIRREHVKAYAEAVSGTQTAVTLDWTGPFTVTVTPAVPSGSTLVVYRDTPKDAPLTDFSDGAIINEANLDLLAKQSIFVAAEMVDRFSDVASQAGSASDLAAAAAGDVEIAVVSAAAALVRASAADALSASVAQQFASLLATVQDLSGADLSQVARINTPQTYSALQTFPAVRTAANGQETEILSDGTFRRRAAGGAWTPLTFNAWADLTGKPDAFPPAEHTHGWGSIFGKPTTFPAAVHTHSYGSLTGVPSTFPPAAHSHNWASITDKPAVAVIGQPANFSTLSVGGTRVVAITSSTSAPFGGDDGDIHFVLP